MTLQQVGSFLDGTVLVSLDVVSSKVAGISVTNTSGKAVVLDLSAAGVSKVASKSCPSGVTTTASITTANRFDISVAGADWTLGVRF